MRCASAAWRTWKRGLQGQCAAQVIARGQGVALSGGDHARVEQVQRLPRTETERLLGLLAGFLELAGLIEGPGERIGSLDAGAVDGGGARLTERLIEVAVVVGEEERHLRGRC